MRTDGSLVGTHWGPSSAIGPQPRRRHESEVRVGTPTAPWRSRRLPRTLLAGDHRRTLFRSLLRRAEGVPVELADGSAGTVEDIVFPVLGFDFWPQELVVGTSDGWRRVSAGSVRRIDVREPRVWIGPTSIPTLERGDDRGDELHREKKHLHRLQRRHDPIEVRMLPGRHRQQLQAPAGSR